MRLPFDFQTSLENRKENESVEKSLYNVASALRPCNSKYVIEAVARNSPKMLC